MIGVLIEQGGANAALADVWADRPAHETAATMVADVTVNASAVIPPDGRYHHEGSLTTSPGSEGVRWFVLSQTITMSAAQIQKVRSRCCAQRATGSAA